MFVICSLDLATQLRSVVESDQSREVLSQSRERPLLFMATAGKWKDLSVSLNPILIDALSRLNFPTMTPVQAATIPSMLSRKDVVVEAETGSGKSLSFLVPAVQFILYEKHEAVNGNDIVVMIVEPTRELALQLHHVATQLFKELHVDVLPALYIGRKEGKKEKEKNHIDIPKDARLVIGTPGRLEFLVQEGILNAKTLELLVLDEADRLLDIGFENVLNSLLTRLPKQRRTGLFSATQTREVEQLIRAGLRNPVAVSVSVAVKNQESIPESKLPASLDSFRCCKNQEDKFPHLLFLMAKNPKAKFIIYFLTCACVDFYLRLPIPRLLMSIDPVKENKNRTVIALHGKMPQRKRLKLLTRFRDSSCAVLFCTDVAARGLDIPDVDFIVQFDPPQDPDSYVHRVGRTARFGRKGTSVLYLAPSEDNYIEFLDIRKAPTRELEFDIDTVAFGLLKDQIKDEARKNIISDRDFYESGKQAFISYLRAYKEHRCHYLLQFEKLNFGSLARSFYLIRLPHVEEFKKLKKKIDFEEDKTIRVKDLQFKNKDSEKRLLERQQKRRDAAEEKKRQYKEKKRQSKDPGRHTFGAEDLDELENDVRLIKKYKRGKLTKEEIDELLQ